MIHRVDCGDLGSHGTWYILSMSYSKTENYKELINYPETATS
jgi:hypothetical protein